MPEEDAAVRLHKVVKDLMLLENKSFSNVGVVNEKIKETLSNNVISPKTRAKLRDRNRKQRKNKLVQEERRQVIQELKHSCGVQQLPEANEPHSSEDSDGDCMTLEPTSETEAEIIRATNSFLAELNDQLDSGMTVVPNMIFADNSFFTFQQMKRRHLALCSIIPTSSKTSQTTEGTCKFLDRLSTTAQSEAIFMRRYWA